MTTENKITAAFYGGLLTIMAVGTGFICHTYKKSCKESIDHAKQKIDAIASRVDHKDE